MMGKHVAPEPYLGAYLHLLYMTVLFIRSRSEGGNRLPDEQLHDLMDAIHNIPSMLCDYGTHFSHEHMISHELGWYDSKWGDKGIRLITVVNDAIEIRKRSLSGRDE